MAEVNRGKMLSMTGLHLKATLFVVGDLTVGKQLFEQDHGGGLYVPLRVFVYADASGKTFVSYDRPSALLGQFQNEKIAMVAQILDQKLEGLANMAAHSGFVAKGGRPSAPQVPTGDRDEKDPSY